MMTRNLIAFTCTAGVLCLAAACGKTGNSTGGANSSAPPSEPANVAGAQSAASSLPAESRSAHFAAVSRHLDLGGPFYGYVDLDGDVDRLGEQLNGFYQAIAETGEVPPVDIGEILAELGIGKIEALGASSIKTANGFRNKTFLYIPDGRAGLLNLLGGDREPLHYPALAPAGADLIVEQELNLKAVRDTAERIVARFASPEIQEPFEEMLESKFADLSFSVADFLGNANGRVILVASIVADTPLPLPPDAPAIPSIDALLCVENAGWLFDSLEEKLITEGGGPFDYAEEGDFQKMAMQVPPDGSMGIYAPVIAKEKSTDRVFLASRQEYLDACLGAGARIGGDAEFKAAVQGLPTEGNSFSYLSPEVYHEIRKISESALDQMGAGGAGMGGPPPAMLSAIQSLTGTLTPDLQDAGIAGVGQNLPDGILYVQNNVASHKATMASMAVMPLAMMGGIAAPMFAMRQQQDMQMQMQMQMGMDAQMEQALGLPESTDLFAETEMDDLPDDDAEGQFDERIGSIKLQQTYAALRKYATENEGRFPDNLGELLPGLLDPSNLRIANTETGQARPIIYLPGRTSTSDAGAVILAAPWPDGEERFVIRVDGTAGRMPEDEFQLQLISSGQ